MQRFAATALLLLAAAASTSATPLRKSFGGRVTSLKAAASATSPDMTYHGGWVLGDADVVIIWYGGWTTTTTVNTPSTISTMTKFLGASTWYNVNR
jgi:hypothetical protein